MPVNREPRIYQGYVISQISRNAGEKEEMEFGNAQICVSSGTHRWADDESDMPNHVQALIADREAKQAETDAANSELNARLRAEREEQERLAGLNQIGAIHFTKVGELIYLARPFPDTAGFTKEIVEPTDGIISVTTENALADYKIVRETDDLYIGDLLYQQLPEVDIPADWRDKAALQLTAMAKKIRGTKESMKADAAKAIIEEWTKTDDQVSVGEFGEGKPEVPDTENRTKSDVTVDTEGKPVLSPEERAKQAEKEGLEDDKSDFF